MQFPPARPDAVRAINQRWLLKLWRQHLEGQRVPNWKSINADSLSRMSANLTLFDVVADKAMPRFLIRFQGTRVQEAFDHPGDVRGRYLDALISPVLVPEITQSYRRAIDKGAPVYTIQDATDRNGRLVYYEKLVLPFAQDGNTVDRLLASFEFVSPDGAFDGVGLMTAQRMTMRFAATIEAEAIV